MTRPIRTPGAAAKYDAAPAPGPTATVRELISWIERPIVRPPFEDPLAAWWFDAPIPRRWHRCHPWNAGAGIERCACGSWRRLGTRCPWMDRNTRQRESRGSAS